MCEVWLAAAAAAEAVANLQQPPLFAKGMQAQTCHKYIFAVQCCSLCMTKYAVAAFIIVCFGASS
jgi:hypothetical protein